ncbi:MarR family winged helix-turn-helix transcriptional regulator [Kitasatospora sp. NPDC059146]|uniref:MarR family winged helix-turn-helix transcriptional regulator n=1 Tax=unclassified Kitasatospora TaxID=2633591 RepID=UPI003696ED47
MDTGERPDSADLHARITRIDRLFADLWLLSERHAPRYGDFGLTAQQHLVLGRIVADPGITPKDLAERLGVSRGAVSQHLARLEEDGYLSRQRSPQDGRVHVLRLEARGAAYRQAVLRYERELHDAYVAKLSAADMAEIESALGKLRRVFED